MGGGPSLSVVFGWVQRSDGGLIGPRLHKGVIPRAPVRLAVMETLPTDILCLHLAGGTAAEGARLTAAFGAPPGWRERSPDEWAAARLPSHVVKQARADWDGRAAEAERRECAARGVRLAS